MDAMTHRSFGERFTGAMRLNTAVYEEVEADTGATGQAAVVVALVAIASAIGGVDKEYGWIGGLVATFVGWGLWSGMTYLIGDKLLGGTATWGELLRTIGFAMSPGVFYVLGFLPLLGWLVEAIVGIWMLVAGVVAVRQALDFGTLRALLTVVVGFIPYLILRAVLFAVLGL